MPAFQDWNRPPSGGFFHGCAPVLSQNLSSAKTKWLTFFCYAPALGKMLYIAMLSGNSLPSALRGEPTRRVDFEPKTALSFAQQPPIPMTKTEFVQAGTARKRQDRPMQTAESRETRSA